LRSKLSNFVILQRLVLFVLFQFYSRWGKKSRSCFMEYDPWQSTKIKQM